MVYVDPRDVPTSKQAQLSKGEILVVRSGAYTGDSAIVPDAYDGAIAGYDMVITVPNADSRFVAWHLLAPEVRELQFGFHTSRAAQPHLNAEELAGTLLLLPPLPEQRAIAAFLDRETAQIDRLIATKKRLIALLEEKRSALISQGVTKGLDPAVPMKDSGVEWLGEIPAHWTVSRLKFAARLESGHTPSRSVPEYWENCTIPWVSLADIAQLRDRTVDVIEHTNEMISKLGLAHSAARLLPKDTVILSRTASVGFSAILGKPMATTQDFANWICSPSLNPRFLLHCFRAMNLEFKRLTMGSTHQTIYMPDIEKFAVPLPSIEEQQAIDRYIGDNARQIDDLVSKIRRQIHQLREYRTALISAAVTGKIDVREQAAL